MSLEWDYFGENPTYQSTMPNLIHTPPKVSDESGTKLVNWKLIVEDREEVVQVNEDQHKYLSLPTTTTEQQAEFLRRIFDAQQETAAALEAAEAEAVAAAATSTVNPDDLRTPTRSPAPSEKSQDTIEEIIHRTKLMEESLRNNNTDVEKLHGHNGAGKNDGETNQEGAGETACKDRHHEFETRAKTFLAALAKKFIKACGTLHLQMNKEKFVDDITVQYGDELLKEVETLYQQVEDTREYCLAPLTVEERLYYGDYMQQKFEMLVTCQRMHRKYFEQQLEDKKLRNQQQQVHPPHSQVQPPYYGSFLSQPLPGVPIAPNIITTTAANNMPNMITSTPYHQHSMPPPGPHSDPMFGQHQQQPHGQHYGQHQQNPPPGAHSDPMFGQSQGQHHGQQYSQPGPQQNPPPGFNNNPPPGFNVNPPPGFNTKPPPGFNVYEDRDQESRIPTPTAPSHKVQHHTRYKLNEELSLVETWDGSKPRAYMAFRAQWTNFVDKMVKSQRSNLDLYYALLKVLGGPAKDLVHTKYPNDQSYTQAIKKLDNLFYNPTNLVRDMVQNLLKGVKMVDTYDSLLSGMTKLWDAWTDLNQADLTKDQLKGLLFIAATEKHLSEESWKCWLVTQNDPKFVQNPMDAFEISAFLGAINTAMLNAQKRKNAIGSNSESSSKTDKPGKKFSTMYGSYSNAVGNSGPGNNQPNTKIQQQARGPNNTCVFCGQSPHKYQLNCPKLREMTANQIYKTMTNFRIECQMCLGLKHRTRDCPAIQEGFLKKCSVKEDNVECGRYHCRALHKPKRANDESTTQAEPKPKQE